MLIIGCDYHPGFQQIAFVETETGEFGERRLTHREEAEQFYGTLKEHSVRVGMEASGRARSSSFRTPSAVKGSVAVLCSFTRCQIHRLTTTAVITVTRIQNVLCRIVRLAVQELSQECRATSLKHQ